jgi:hypothetical protein
MSRLATLLLSIGDAIRAFFTRAAPPDPLAPPSASPGAAPGAAPGPRPITPAVRSFILDGHTKEIRASLVEQIEQYEAAGATSFTLQYPGGYYVIRDGQVVGAGRYK